MSEKRRRSGGEGRGKRILVWSGWGLLVVLLGGNVVIALMNRDKDETPQGVLQPEHLQAAAFWVPIAVCLVMSLLGLFWSSKAYAQNERASLLWARRGYVFSLVGSVALAMAVFDPETFKREWLAAFAAVIVGGQSVFFAMLALGEYRRADSGEGGRRGRSRPSPAAPVIGEGAPPPTARSSESSGPAR